ncbi:ribosome maturation factor RimP [bacterium]|nr:ribosome maturation factor RimP [bacterium]
MWAQRAKALFDDIEKIANSMELSVVDIETPGRENGVFRLFIERMNGEAVSLDDCSKISPVVSDWLDTLDSFSFKYRLEVSSPGLDRSIRRWDHIARFIGSRVKVSTGTALAGRRRFTGILQSVDEEKEIFVLIDDEKNEFEIRRDNVKKMHVIYEGKI